MQHSSPAQLVRTNESSDLKTELKCLRIYGDVILFGGTNGFLGVGAMGFTTSVDAQGEPQQVMFCVPCGTSQEPSAASSPYPTPTAATYRPTSIDEYATDVSSPVSSSSSKASVGTAAAAAGPTPNRKNSRSNSFMSGSGASAGYPHRRTATVTCIAAAQDNHRFVAADDEGTLSLWYFYKHNAISDNVEGLKSPKKTPRKTIDSTGSATAAAASSSTTGGAHQQHQRRGSEKLMVRRPHLKCVFSLSSIDLAGTYAGERVVEMNFLLDESQLIVSTNKRLILLVLGKLGTISSAVNSPIARMSAAAADFQSPAPHSADGGVSNSSSNAVSDNTERADLSVIGWVELDRAIPGKVGLFAMHMSQSYVPPFPGASTAVLKRNITQWRITEEDGAVSSRFQLNTRKKGAGDGKSKCTVYRFEWSDSMFEAVLDKIKYF